jgi:uncharacterized protein YjbI with pentapeptide repeats
LIEACPLSVCLQSILASTPAQKPSFVGMSLAGADLHDLTKLPGGKLNLAWIIGADFSHADLSGADLETLVVSAGMQTLPQEDRVGDGAHL